MTAELIFRQLGARQERLLDDRLAERLIGRARAR